jgi:amino acid adenylation domain-containing protein
MMKSVAGQQRERGSVLLRREVSPEKQALIAKRLRGKEPTGGTSGPAESSIQKSGATQGPLSFGQQRFWFLEQLEPGQPVYNVCFGVRLTGRLDYPVVQASLSEIVRRHEALRTVFTNRQGTPVQVVMPPRPVAVPLMDVDGADEEEFGRLGEALRGEGPRGEEEGVLRRRLEQEAAKPFDLTKDLLMRAALFRLAPEKHILFVTMHHIATDAWSIQLFLEEWTALYSAYVQGREAELAELPIQYLDFASWQRQDQQTEDVAYWKGRLEGSEGFELRSLGLKSETPLDVSGIPSNRGATRSTVLSRELSDALQQLSRAEGASIFMALLAGFKVLLHRYSGQEDIVIGSPISRRTQQQTEQLIGLFLNVAVLRTDTSGNPTFRELLRRVRTTALEAYAHQNIPFEKLVEELQPARDRTRTPLFQMMFTFQDALMPRRTLGPFQSDGARLEVEAFDFDLQVAPFDLMLLMQESGQGLVATLEYKTDLFSAEVIDRMLGHWRALLEGIVQRPDARISDLPLLTTAERRQVLIEFNSDGARAGTEHWGANTDGGGAPSQPGKCVHELFEEQAARNPEGRAIKFGGQAVSYRELNERANQLAHYLKVLGVGVETRVGICMERSPEMIAAVLGILKAGGAYVPFEPDEPRDRLAFKLRDSAVEVLLTQQRLLDVFAGLDGPGTEKGASGLEVVCVDRDHEVISRHRRDNPRERPRPNNLVYVIYTSGSTGAPKGVLIEHHCLVEHALEMARRFGLNAADRVLQFAPLSFDVSAEEIFPTLATGGRLVLRPAGLAVSIQDFQPFATNEKLTVVNLPTPYWAQWMTAMEQENLTLPPSLRLVIVGSDTVTGEQYAQWQKLSRRSRDGAPVRWCNAYGTTEATITATIYEPESDEAPFCVPIGRPMRHTRIYILDAHRGPVPIGVPGEIYIGGDEVARGYLNRPEATAANFVVDVFSRRPGARLNRTGDFGRWRPDGNIEFLGRRDNQVKIRGFRIELGEVEAALLEHPLVKEAAVLPREDTCGEKRLVAYFVGREDQMVGKLQQFLRQRLPAYMIPATFVSLEKIPRLSNGKLKVDGLPAPAAERPDLEEDFVAPSDSLEEKLANIWRQVLGLEKVGVNDNFFDLGGHSLLAIRLFAEIEKLTGWNLPVLSVFQSPTIKGLAEIIRRKQSTERRSSILTVQPHGTKPPLFLVHGAGGGMLWGYANLAKHLGVDQPVYAFNSRGMDGLEEFATTEELAAQYVQELRTFQKQGPYYLGGYCFGGEVAFEMAQQLMAQGERVGLLALMNAMPPNSSFGKMRFSPVWAMRFMRNSWHWLRYFCRWTPQQKRSFVQRKVRACQRRLQRCLGRNGAPDGLAELTVDLSLYSEEQRRLWDMHLRASDNYHPRPFPGSVVVFRTRFHPFFCSFDPSFGWNEFAGGGVKVEIVPGAHESILDEPYVQTTAAKLKKCLEQAHASGQDAASQPLRVREIASTLLSSVIWMLEVAPAF